MNIINEPRYAEVSIRRESDKVYTYRVPDYIDVAVGDTVVVKVNPSNRGDGYCMLGRVTALTDYPRNVSERECKPLVQKVDLERYEREVEAHERREELLERMKARAHEANLLAVYRQLAVTDAVMKQLLETYDGLSL